MEFLIDHHLTKTAKFVENKNRGSFTKYPFKRPAHAKTWYLLHVERKATGYMNLGENNHIYIKLNLIKWATRPIPASPTARLV